MIIDQLFTRPLFEAADPSKLIVSVRIEPMSTGGEPIDKEVDLTGQFQGSMGSQMNQALDYMKKMLESKGLYFTTLTASYQGRILNMQNRGAMSPQSDEEREMDAMANQIRAKQSKQTALPAVKEDAASPEQLAYNRLRAQYDGYQAMTSGGGNTAVSRDPAHAAKLATVPAELARMAAALKAKGIDAEAQYDALSGPKSAPVDANQAYGLSENKSDPITQFASNAHEEWRRNFDPTGTKPRIKKNSDGTEGDINVPFADLHPDWQKENLAAAHAAHRAVKHFGRDMEKAAEYVHNEWMKRNPKADYNAAQHVPYDDLPQDEKEKDRVHVRTMMQLMGHSPEQGVAESNTLMKKLHQAMVQEGRVKELADDLKTLNDTEFMKKYGKNKAAIRRDMKKVDEGNANSGRRGPNSPPDNTPVKLGRVQKLKTGIKHHADSSRYGGTVPDTDDDHLLSPAARHRLHKAVTPDQQDLDEGNMPQSVVKSKQKYADMSDQEFHAAHKNKSEDDLKSMAWRHGYGKGSNHYVNRHKKGGGQLNELSTNKLAQYKTAAAADAKKADQAGDVKRGDKRFGGIVKATKKQFDNDAKKIDESRQARQALMAQIVNSR